MRDREEKWVQTGSSVNSRASRSRTLTSARNSSRLAGPRYILFGSLHLSEPKPLRFLAPTPPRLSQAHNALAKTFRVSSSTIPAPQRSLNVASDLAGK